MIIDSFSRLIIERQKEKEKCHYIIDRYRFVYLDDVKCVTRKEGENRDKWKSPIYIFFTFDAYQVFYVILFFKHFLVLHMHD